MSVTTDIKRHVIANVQRCASVDKVYGHEEVNPSGWPAVMVTAGNIDGEFVSNAENSRVYAFKVQAFFPVGQDYPGPAETNRLEYAEQVLATVIDEMINVFDTDFELEGANPTVLYVDAADAVWGYVEMENGSNRSVEITLKIYTEKTVV
jgi:hypothetical protein